MLYEVITILAKELPRARDPIRITLVPKGEDELELRGTVRWTTEQLAHGTQNARGSPAVFPHGYLSMKRS